MEVGTFGINCSIEPRDLFIKKPAAISLGIFKVIVEGLYVQIEQLDRPTSQREVSDTNISTDVC